MAERPAETSPEEERLDFVDAVTGDIQSASSDVEDGPNAASAIGDDRLQRRSQGRVSPESFTHGSSAQRVSWFKRGMESGDPRACDTFADSR